jgi:hypothetical protein
MEVWFEVGTYELLFGIPNENDEDLVNQLNFFIMIAKYYVYKNKKAAKALDAFEVLAEIKNRLEMKLTLLDENNEPKFKRKWAQLLDVFLIG